MLTASRSLTRSLTTAEPFPEIPALRSLYESGVTLRRGQLVLLAGLPKAGKTAFCMWLAATLNQRTLYFSADSSPHTASTRIAAIATGHTVNTVTAGLQAGAGDYYSEALEDSKIQWCFDSSPSTEDIEQELAAYVEAWDAWPDLIVVDNLMNVQASEEFEGLKFVMSELHSLARTTGSLVIVLHHCSEAGIRDTTVPPPRSSIQGKVSQLPELILTAAHDPATSTFRIAVVGNRSGPQHPDGKKFITLDAAIERCSFTHHTPSFYGYGYQEDET